jgi:hypothetical protein
MTSTDVAVPATGRDVSIPGPSASISTMVAQYATDLQHCAGFAEAIIDTPFVPAGLWPLVVLQRGDQVITLKATGRDGWDPRRQHPQETDDAFAWRRRNAIATTGAIVYSGAILGLNWQAALSGIYVANGRTSLYAEQMRALILSDGHSFDILERGDHACRVSVQRRGDSAPTEFTFAMDEAIRAGYVKGKGPNVGSDSWKGNDRYNTNPSDMLFARATSIAAKAKFADVIRGMETRETLDDDRPAPVDITAQVEVSRPAERPTAAAILAAAGQDADGADTDMPVERAVLPIAEGTWRKINARFVDLEVVGEGQTAHRLTVIGHIVGRPIGRGSDLTADEGQLVLDNLAGDAGYVVLGEALGRTEPPAPAPAGDDADELLDDGDPNQQWNDLDGAEAAAEGNS